MPKGVKFGGRQKGTPNKATQAIEERLAAFGCDPVEGLCKIALDETVPTELRLRAHCELASFVVPRRKALDLNVGLESGKILLVGMTRDWETHQKQIEEIRSTNLPPKMKREWLPEEKQQSEASGELPPAEIGRNTLVEDGSRENED